MKTKQPRLMWQKHFGPIPKDTTSRTYEIHHIDGNRKNSDISNLKLVSIDEHYAIHLRQEDWGACALIGRRMGLAIDHFSKIQLGKPKSEKTKTKISEKLRGRIPWNKYIKGYKLKCNSRKGRRFGPLKLSNNDVIKIRDLYQSKMFMEEYNIYMTYLPPCLKGRTHHKQSYETFLAKKLQKTLYSHVTDVAIYQIISGKSRNVLI